jgi:hypothetical protein
MTKQTTKRPDDYIQRELESFQKVFKAENEVGVWDALRFCKDHSVLPPPWLFDALIVRERAVLFGEYKRHGKWIKQFKQDMIDFERAEAVTECREHGAPWKVVYETAARMLEWSRTGAQGKPDAIAKSYKRFQQRMKTDPCRYYIPRYIRQKETKPATSLKEWGEWFEKTFPETTDPKTGETIRRYK